MAVKPIRFRFEGSELVFQMHKVDRSRLYGFKVLEVLDETNSPCELATLADDGRTLLGKGGTGIGYLTADGLWADKSKLKPVNLEGDEITPVPSSFAAPIDLLQETTVDDYLNHIIRLVYMLKTEPGSASEENLVRKLNDGAIYKFLYSYRGGLEADIGFILTNETQEIFFLVAQPTQLEYLGLGQVVVPAEEDDQPDEVDLMDFEMI